MRIVFTCVADNKPMFTAQTRRLVITLMRLAAVPPGDILINLVEEPDPDLLEFLDKSGVMQRRFARVSAAVPTLNRLTQLSAPELKEADVAVFCDCDLAFSGDVRSIASLNSILGRQVALANPPLRVWKRILREAGLQAGELIACTVSGEPTLHENLNGGFMMMPRPYFLRLGEAWPPWVEWLEERIHLLEDWHYHLIQVSFTLACIEQKIPIKLIPPAYNYPLRRRGALGKLIGDTPPIVLHYHDAIDEKGDILRQGHPVIDAVIDCVNNAVSAFAPSHHVTIGQSASS